MLFAGFVFLVAWVLLAFLRWVDRVTRLGRMGDTLARVMAEGRQLFTARQLSLLGGRSQADGERPGAGYELKFNRFGFVQHIDMAALQAVAVRLDGEIWLDMRPGKLAETGRIYGVFSGPNPPAEADLKALHAAISIGEDRNFTMDPRFVLIMLAEIADKALSPAVNDPGTAIKVLGLQLELLHLWVGTEREGARDKPEFGRIRVPRITAADLVQDAFTPILRDGAGSLEVEIRLHKTLRSLQRLDHAELQAAVRDCRVVALELAEHALVAEAHRQIIRDLVQAPL
jgi:uncharacterized membrane protein